MDWYTIHGMETTSASTEQIIPSYSAACGQDDPLTKWQQDTLAHMLHPVNNVKYREQNSQDMM